MYFTELECLGTFQSYIQTKRDLPFKLPLSRRAIEKIRTGKFDLTKDLPMMLICRRDQTGGLPQKMRIWILSFLNIRLDILIDMTADSKTSMLQQRCMVK